MKKIESILQPTLKNKNRHPRDENLLFDEPTHKYTITTDLNSKYTSVTTWNHSHFPHFDADEVIKNMMNGKNWNAQNKYWNMTAEEIKKMWKQNGESVSGAGTDLHFDIECFMNEDIVYEDTHESLSNVTHYELNEVYQQQIEDGLLPPNDSLEWGYFLEYIKDFPQFEPYRTEWTIYHEDLKLAGSIDMVYKNEDGTLNIYDWKRAKEISKTTSFKKYALTECIDHLPDTNFWHYSLQLNTYKAILESKYDKKIKDLYLVRLHPNNPKKSYELIKCADLSNEIQDLFEYRKKQLNK
jgi:ATP-dependent exoDNAse (exonuclease V) beta subunit